MNYTFIHYYIIVDKYTYLVIYLCLHDQDTKNPF